MIPVSCGLIQYGTTSKPHAFTMQLDYPTEHKFRPASSYLEYYDFPLLTTLLFKRTNSKWVRRSCEFSGYVKSQMAPTRLRRRLSISMFSSNLFDVSRFLLTNVFVFKQQFWSVKVGMNTHIFSKETSLLNLWSSLLTERAILSSGLNQPARNSVVTWIRTIICWEQQFLPMQF